MQGIKVQYQEARWIPNRVKSKEMHQDTVIKLTKAKAKES